MAAVNLRKGFICVPKNFVAHLQRCYASSKQTNINTLAAVGDSIAAKGFLRPNKPYAPTSNAAERVRSVAAKLHMTSDGDQRKLTDLGEKFKFLSACFEELQHGVPNSQVHELATVADVIAFYEQAVDTTVPLDALKRIDLPENLHIQYEYLRFHPETDTKFNGQTAFPKSSTLVTGLKYRRKYGGHEVKQSWP
ncbi:39S ribosomal protein L50, mitochondrial [Drosophila grimshawi]|uniref:Large ribosomal subunit protein mL50 n=1 Tax=Drosophila grimshawi TaxID=7222 RepID=B4IY74_DROGR|nr:39S ribosomal protein L50, mitochondrial [Drosophila grimshawi]EDV96524.1 GH16299 [Drosophila grimshawi]